VTLESVHQRSTSLRAPSRFLERNDRSLDVVVVKFRDGIRDCRPLCRMAVCPCAFTMFSKVSLITLAALRTRVLALLHRDSVRTGRTRWERRVEVEIEPFVFAETVVGDL
jgi:hypothetical protein